MSKSQPRDPKREQFWRTTLAKWTTSGPNIRDFCRRHRLAETAFYFWRREIARRDGAPAGEPAVPHRPSDPRRTSSLPRPARPAAPRRTPTTPAKPSFVPIRVVPDRPLELVLRSGHVLRVPPGYDGRHLRAVVAALEAESC